MIIQRVFQNSNIWVWGLKLIITKSVRFRVEKYSLAKYNEKLGCQSCKQ